ncbi:MAG TPA: DUF3108 domain-containing protein [Casimicrobiaceae bacterium]|nr:DUF3108 domain-containing protein [Casimicrobiaceae bacterium]
MSPRSAFFASSDRPPASRVLALAALASLAVHVALLQTTIRLPDRVDESPPLVATITELPPPPAPVEKATPPKPRRQHVVRAAPPVPVETPAPEVVAAAAPVAEPAAAPEPVAPPPLEETIPAAPSLAPPRELPPRIDLAYRAFLGTRGFLIGDAVYRLEHSGSQYRISTVGEARGLAALLFPGEARAKSEGAITADGLQPTSYSVERSSGNRREAASFDWESGMVQLNGDQLAPLELPTFDPLVVLWQFYFSPPAQDETEFNIATTRKIYHVTFRRVGTEKITLPFGEVDTEIWKRVDADSTIQAQVWLAPSLRYVAVKLRLSNARATVEGLLDSIRVDDTVAQQ